MFKTLKILKFGMKTNLFLNILKKYEQLKMLQKINNTVENNRFVMKIMMKLIKTD